MKYIYLSYNLDPQSPRPPAIPAPELNDFLTIEKDGASVQFLSVYNHTGTHLDTAGHVFKDGVSITDFRPEDLIFRNVAVCHLNMQNKTTVQINHIKEFIDSNPDNDMIIFNFGCGAYRNSYDKRYSSDCPGFSIESIKYIKEKCKNLRCIGLDTPSIATIHNLAETMETHNAFLEGNSRKMLIIEEMKLDDDLQGLVEIRINPWLVKGMNSGPCSVIAVLD